MNWIAKNAVGFLSGAILTACNGSPASPGSGGGGDTIALSTGSAPPGSGGGGGAGGLVSAEQACTDFVSAVCAKDNECWPLIIEAAYGDVETCVKRASLECSLGLVFHPGSTITPTFLEACSNTLTSLTCEALPTLVNEAPAACTPAVGSQINGTTCGDDGQCQSTYCKKDIAAVCGVCAARVAAGGACSGDCEKGLLCANGTCVTPVAAGGACDQSHFCQTGLACNAGVCAVRLGAGAACSTSAVCDLAQGLLCDASQTCQPFSLAKAGEPCGLVGGKNVLCVAGGTCTADSGMMGTCVAPVPDGGACDPTQNLNCTQPAECVNAVCTLPSSPSCN